jgi:glucose dehydrogenase
VRRKLFIVAVVVIVAAALLAILAPGAKRFMTRTFPYQSAFYAGLARNYIWSWSAPPGATTTEANPAYNAGAPAAAPRSAAPPANAAGDWPSYNRTLTSERFADLSEINAGNVGRLKVV